MSSLLFLPSGFYELREHHSLSLAAIVLIEPSLTPSREDLPRDGLHPDLAKVLAANALRIGVMISAGCVERVGKDTICSLLRMLSRPDVFVFNFHWHLAAVKELQAVESMHERLIKKIIVTAMESEKISHTFGF